MKGSETALGGKSWGGNSSGRKSPGRNRSGRKTGRPLSFDPEAAVVDAMLLFWKHGYEATSLSALTHAMGVTSPSIYAAYGDKKGLFRAAVRRYLSHSQTPREVIQQAPTAEAAARTLLQGAVEAFTGKHTPPGCLLASSAIAVSPGAQDIREELSAIRRDIELALRAKIASAVVSGELPAGTDAAALAAYVITVVQGLSTMARDGSSRQKLARVARLAMTTWPSPKRP